MYVSNIFSIESAAIAAAVGFLGYKILKFYHNKSNKCIVIESLKDWELHEAEIKRKFYESKIIGIDCEWVTIENKRSPVSLLQLATDDEFCVLIRLSFLPQCSITTCFSALIGKKDLLKVGVGAIEDVNKLLKDYGLDVYNVLDLRHLVHDMAKLQCNSLGLKCLAYELLGVDLDKDKSLRCSNWDAQTLSEEQVKYAANDAIIAAKLFSEIKKRRLKLLSEAEFWKEIENYYDMPFHRRTINNNQENISSSFSITSKFNNNRYSKPRQKRMYDNCQLLAPDGELLSMCDRTKAQWYIYKDLGMQIWDDPFTVQLNFEPSGRPTLDKVFFYCREKQNSCVVCGKTEDFHRKVVVPSEYRKYFPTSMKKGLSHDVLLLCAICHKKSNLLDQKMRQNLAQLCDAPFSIEKDSTKKTKSLASKVKSAAFALIANPKKMTVTRHKILEKIITDYYGVDEITDKLLGEARNLEINSSTSDFVTHGQKVYHYFCENGGLFQLEKMWRQHFLDSMKPQYLPEMWSVEHNHKRLATRVVNHEREFDFDERILGLTPDLLKDIQVPK